MKKYALNFSFTNGSIICIVMETDLDERRFWENLTCDMTKDIAFFTDINGATYMIQKDKLNYFMCSEIPEETEEAADGLRDCEVEEEETAHPEA